MRLFSKSERGAALLLVMVFMVVVTLIVIPVLTLSSTGIKSGGVFNDKADTLYAADSGIEDAKWQIRYDQLSGKFGNYDSHDYSTAWAYSLPLVSGQPQINRKVVNVTLKNDWIPKNISAPDKTTANNIINSTKLIVTGGAFGTSSYNIVITYYPAIRENLKINTIGIWLPPGFTYKAGTSNLGSEPATSGYQGGQSVIWSLSAVAFTSLPGANPTNMPMTAKITFDYSPSTTVATSAASSRQYYPKRVQHSRISPFR